MTLALANHLPSFIRTNQIQLKYNLLFDLIGLDYSSSGHCPRKCPHSSILSKTKNHMAPALANHLPSFIRTNQIQLKYNLLFDLIGLDYSSSGHFPRKCHDSSIPSISMSKISICPLHHYLQPDSAWSL